jgi:hypothetical protein
MYPASATSWHDTSRLHSLCHTPSEFNNHYAINNGIKMLYKGVYEGKHWQYNGYTLFCQNKLGHWQEYLRQHFMTEKDCKTAVKMIVSGYNKR